MDKEEFEDEDLEDNIENSIQQRPNNIVYQCQIKTQS